MATQYQSMEPKMSGPHGASISPLLDQPEKEQAHEVIADDIFEMISKLPKQLGGHDLDMLKYNCEIAFSRTKTCKIEGAIMAMANLGVNTERLKVDAARAWDDGLITHEEMDTSKDKLTELRDDTMPSLIASVLATMCNCKSQEA